MKSKEIIRQRPLFTDWPAWQELPTEVTARGREVAGQHVSRSCEPYPTKSNVQERRDELPAD